MSVDTILMLNAEVLRQNELIQSLEQRNAELTEALAGMVGEHCVLIHGGSDSRCGVAEKALTHKEA